MPNNEDGAAPPLSALDELRALLHARSRVVAVDLELFERALAEVRGGASLTAAVGWHDGEPTILIETYVVVARR